MRVDGAIVITPGPQAALMMVAAQQAGFRRNTKQPQLLRRDLDRAPRTP